jgi:hypothetical protein
VPRTSLAQQHADGWPKWRLIEGDGLTPQALLRPSPPKRIQKMVGFMVIQWGFRAIYMAFFAFNGVSAIYMQFFCI